MTSITESKRLHLVDDEVVYLVYKGEDAAFRLRIWQGRGETPVALASRVPGHISPNRVTTRLANLAYHAYLTYHERGLYFVEWDSPDLRQVNFIGWGKDERLFLMKPERYTISHDELNGLVGHRVIL